MVKDFVYRDMIIPVCCFGSAKLLAVCRRVLLVCKLSHHLDGEFCPEAERVISGMAI